MVQKPSGLTACLGFPLPSRKPPSHGKILTSDQICMLFLLLICLFSVQFTGPSPRVREGRGEVSLPSSRKAVSTSDRPSRRRERRPVWLACGGAGACPRTWAHEFTGLGRELEFYPVGTLIIDVVLKSENGIILWTGPFATCFS